MTQHDPPEPMTPADCDLRGMPFMPLDLVRLFDSDIYALSTGEEFKAAFTLWGKSFLQVPAGSLPDDDRVLAHLSGAGRRWARVKEMALRGFVKCSDGRLYHPVVCDKAREAWAYRLRQRGRAEKRWQSHGNATANAGAHATGDATAHPAAMQGTVKGQGQLNPDARASAPRPAQGDLLPPELVPDPRKAIFGDGLRWLMAKTARPESSLRSMLGRWAKQRGDPDLAAALIAAQQQDVHDPVSWIEARLNRNGTAKSTSASRGRDMAAAALRVGERLDRDAELPQRSGVQTE